MNTKIYWKNGIRFISAIIDTSTNYLKQSRWFRKRKQKSKLMKDLYIRRNINGSNDFKWYVEGVS